MDLGGTRMRAAIVSADGGIRERRSQPTPQDAECPDALLALAGDVLQAGRVERAVIGLPGRLHDGAGQLEHAPTSRPRGHRRSRTTPWPSGSRWRRPSPTARG
ncbi:MAG: hypothetical protein KY462_09910 [Actinobacteria bacterium]|nr:hypothetical protein [Actinomycetota bacterium]